MTRLVVPAPAKLNLFLHVTGRRPDGYHELESLMVLLDFGDTLTLETRDDGRIELTHPTPGVAPEQDLTHRAATLLQRETGTKQGVTLAIDKHTPMGAGMGGGSSDAASVLLALNRLWQLNLDRAKLMQLGLQLGADVPFFIFGQAAHVTGIGERLEAVTVPPLAAVILMPPVHVPTAAIFGAPDLVRNTPRSNAGAFPPDFGRNDMQPPAVARFPAIATALHALDSAEFGEVGRKALSPARMTGSGAAVFRLVDRGFPASEESWRAAGDRLREEWKFLQRILYHAPKAHGPDGKPAAGTRLICVRIIDRHPLREFTLK